MGNKYQHLYDLHEIWTWVKQDGTKLCDYISQNSNLPSRRGNLELIIVFGELIISRDEEEAETILSLCKSMLEFDSEIAPKNNKMELIAFCGVIGVGKLGIQTQFRNTCLGILYNAAQDKRWRVREAVVMALQSLIESQPMKFLMFLMGGYYLIIT